jgi:hypothetical protein
MIDLLNFDSIDDFPSSAEEVRLLARRLSAVIRQEYDENGIESIIDTQAMLIAMVLNTAKTTADTVKDSLHASQRSIDLAGRTVELQETLNDVVKIQGQALSRRLEGLEQEML